MRLSDWLLGFAHCVVWIGFMLLCEQVFADSPARSAYGLLCAWWATLYGAAVLGTGWRSVAVFLLGMTVALAIGAVSGWDVLYHDTPSPLSIGFIGAAGLQWVLWASPFVVNSAVTWVCSRIRTAAV